MYIIILYTQYGSTGIAKVYSIKPYLKENSDLTFSFKLFPFLVTAMSKTYKKRINSPKINVFRHNIREIQRNMFFLFFRLILLNSCIAKTLTPPNF